MSYRPSPQLSARIAGPMVSLLARSWRIETQEVDRWRRLVERRLPFCFMLWHEALLPLLWQHRDQGVVIVVSEARDGRYLAAYARRLGYREISGSTTQGAVRALLSAVRTLEAGGIVAFTPDGPQGPRRTAQAGLFLAAQRTGALVLPLHAEADRQWRLGSWDRFLIPKPFARVRIVYGEPFGVDPGDQGLATSLELGRRAMDHVVEASQWSRDGATHTA